MLLTQIYDSIYIDVVFESVIVVAFQNIFRLKIYQNNIFFILKNYL
jgi:hypothetical protein